MTLDEKARIATAFPLPFHYLSLDYHYLFTAFLLPFH